jgi:hypothetical protein
MLGSKIAVLETYGCVNTTRKSASEDRGSMSFFEAEKLIRGHSRVFGNFKERFYCILVRFSYLTEM